jgi:hypothetical protein
MPINNVVVAMCGKEKEIDNMYEVKGKDITFNVMTLDEAMKTAKVMNEYVTIKSKEFELVGIFGADEIVEGVLPNGFTYDWKKRRI